METTKPTQFAAKNEPELRRHIARWRDRIETLTPRERRVAELILMEEPNKAISQDLDVSLRTVDRVRALVFEKMDVCSAIGLAQRLAAVRAIEAWHRIDSSHHVIAHKKPHAGQRALGEVQ